MQGRTLDCVVSKGSGEVRTMDIDRVRLCTGEVGTSRTDGPVSSCPIFLATSSASSSGFSACGVVDGKGIGRISGDVTLTALGLCELGRTRFALLLSCRDDSPTCSFLSSTKPTAEGRVPFGSHLLDATVLTVRFELRLVRELAVVTILAVASSKRWTYLS